MLRKLLGAAAIASVVLTGAAQADVIDLTTTGGGSAVIKFNNFESFTDGLNIGSQNYGTFTVTSISVDNTPVSIPSGTFLLGMFSGITVNSVNGTAPNINIGNTGGVFSIIQVTAAQLASASLTIGTLFNQGTGGYAAAGGGCAINMQCYNGISNVGGTDFLDFKLVPGADSTNPLVDTLAATVTTSTVPAQGSASGYGVITGGTAAYQFVTGQFLTGAGTLADVSFADQFCPNGSNLGSCSGTVGNWDEQSFDPARAAVSAPEPITLSLLGVSLIGLGVARRRR